VLVDLSNITRQSTIGPSVYPASLQRWDRTRAAWIAEFGQPDDGFYLVADANLASKMSASDRRKLEDLVARGEAEIAPSGVEADDIIMDYLARRTATVVALDKYRDKMNRPEARESDIRLIVVRGASLTFEKRKHERILSAHRTSLADAKLMQRLGLHDNSPELGFRWLCKTATCQPVVELPDVQRGVPACPHCGAFLDKGERWRRPVWVKLMTRETAQSRWAEADRFIIEDGDERIIGREHEYRDGAELEVLPFLAEQVGMISRRHLQIDNVDGTIFVEDLGSTHGTDIQAALPNGQWAPWVPLRSGVRRQFTKRTRIRLAKTHLVIELSGRTLPDVDH
jgi:hypothetical protein